MFENPTLVLDNMLCAISSVYLGHSQYVCQ